jgi:hypothetical protein
MKKRISIISLATVMGAFPAFAAGGIAVTEIGLAGWLFIGFLAVIIMFQLLPALAMFVSMIIALFDKTDVKKGNAETEKPARF